LLALSYICSNSFFLGKSDDKPLGGYPGGVRKRVGTFEEFYSRKQHDHLKSLTDYVIANSILISMMPGTRTPSSSAKSSNKRRI
jgi:hypothetical protein